MPSTENLSLSFPRNSRACEAEAIVNAQPQAGSVQTFANGVSMPGNGNDQRSRRDTMRLRGGSASTCCWDCMDWLFPCEVCQPFNDCMEDQFCCPFRTMGC